MVSGWCLGCPECFGCPELFGCPVWVSGIYVCLCSCCMCACVHVARLRGEKGFKG